MDNPITRAEHEEFRRTVEAEFNALTAENSRQNHRLEKLESVTDQINKLALSVQELAQSVKTMSENQAKEDDRLEALEARDGQKWRSALKIIGTALAGAAVGALFAWLGLA
ncbi:MAG: hypothetical protein LUC48_09985 [Clostridiales bacterium]|nr:hypothetical protein [Clostridiales bacterium]